MPRPHCLAAFVLTFASASQAQAPGPGTPTTCVASWPEVTRTPRGHDHYVRLLSRCRIPVRCEVSSKENPEPVRVVVAPGEERRVLVFRNSPEPRFVPRVTCRVPPRRVPLSR